MLCCAVLCCAVLSGCVDFCEGMCPTVQTSGASTAGNSAGAAGGGSSGSSGLAPSYSIGGTVTGLTGTLVLQNNGGDHLTIHSGSNTLTFATPLFTSAAYAVTVVTQPTGQFCAVSNGSGTVSHANVTDVNVTCLVSGTAKWASAMGTGAGGASKFMNVAVDSSGSAYVVGVLYGQNSFPFGSNATAVTGVSSSSAVIVKYDSSGIAQWASTPSVAPNSSFFSGVSVDASGNAYAVGYINGNGSFTFGSSTVTISGVNSSGTNAVIV